MTGTVKRGLPVWDPVTELEFLMEWAREMDDLADRRVSAWVEETDKREAAVHEARRALDGARVDKQRTARRVEMLKAKLAKKLEEVRNAAND